MRDQVVVAFLVVSVEVVEVWAEGALVSSIIASDASRVDRSVRAEGVIVEVGWGIGWFGVEKYRKRG